MLVPSQQTKVVRTRHSLIFLSIQIICLEYSRDLNRIILAPSAPVLLQTFFMPPASLSITWKEPVEANGVLKYYNVRYQEHRGDDSVTTLSNVTKLSVVISVTYTSYLIQVTALLLSL